MTDVAEWFTTAHPIATFCIFMCAVVLWVGLCLTVVDICLRNN